MIINKDKYLTSEEKKKKANRTTRVLGRIVKYREEEQAGKLSRQLLGNKLPSLLAYE